MKIAVTMILKMLLRQSFVLLLIFVIPLVFLTIVELTASTNEFPISLAGSEDEINLIFPERQISLVYYSIASCGFLVSFLSLYLIQQNHVVNKRLVLCGFNPSQLLLATFAALVLVIITIGIYVGSLTFLFHKYEHFIGFILGLFLVGFVYGGYGLLIGSILKKELEGILMIVLLVNIDVGWLQNPVFFSHAENKDFIKYLPGYNPTHSTLIQAFSDEPAYMTNTNALIYGAVLMLLAIIVYSIRMKFYK